MKKPIKKLTAIILCISAMLSLCIYSNAAQKDTGVRVRDPYVLEYEGTYYMYGTGLANRGYGCVTSDDLINWSAPTAVFTPDGDFDGSGCWWAPECHYYNGSFYLFATYLSAASGKRGVGIFRSQSPLGPFELISDGHITPKELDAIDGTLYIDEKGDPWLIYVGEWTSNEDGIGNMMAARMSDDLSELISDPILLFRADGTVWATGKITDGPFLYKTKNGRLIMLWSNSSKGGYSVGIAYSSNGKIDGEWYQQPTMLYSGNKKRLDGGHGMIFTAKDGTLLLSIHSPNQSTSDTPTTAVFEELTDIGDTILLSGENNLFTRAFYKLYYTLADLLHTLKKVC